MRLVAGTFAHEEVVLALVLVLVFEIWPSAALHYVLVSRLVVMPFALCVC